MSGQRTELYRHFNGKGALLYVGISLCSAGRLGEHRLSARWFAQIRRIDIEVFPTREEAIEAERRAIFDERPKYNIVGRNHGPPLGYKPKPGGFLKCIW